LGTKKPAWNSELQRWIHHFGGRVKVPSNNNFLLIHSSAETSNHEKDGPSLHSAHEFSRNELVLRHGKVY